MQHNKTYRVISDQVGTPMLVVDANSGKVVEEYSFDEFGVVEDLPKNPILPFGFAGGLYDDETGLVHFGMREYDAEMGRWTTKDPIGFNGGDTNLYGYVANDPVNFVDPSGLRTVVIITRDYGLGTHAAVHISNGNNPVLFDPAGSYRGGSRGSGDYFTDSEANLNDYINYQVSTGSTVEQYVIETTKKEEESIALGIYNYGGSGSFSCAIGVSSVLGGCGINTTWFPGFLADQLKAKSGQCKK